MVKCGREVSVLKAGVVSALTAWFCSVGNCGAVEASEEDAANCGAWAAAGECAKNPEYMKAACPVSCGDGPAGICAEHTISECPSSAKACGAVCDKNVEKAAVAATKGASVVTAQVPPVAHGPDTPDCEKHPGGCRCYYDALADGCPGSIGRDGSLALCTCDYRDNTWLNVLTNFLWAFRQEPEQRHLLASKFDVRLEPSGLLS
eukprot:TRINITY_DN29835_c0_g1_i2.p2 TRINITY_DN29835_c0_g1~~TRINITY_DN29835_c0_g1_i2.p2  ORF type:complete len:204 (-),score=28.52 TRINITY_DN29835_c0_g1_i2:652-1263(-)